MITLARQFLVDFDKEPHHCKSTAADVPKNNPDTSLHGQWCLAVTQARYVDTSVLRLPLVHIRTLGSAPWVWRSSTGPIAVGRRRTLPLERGLAH